MSEQTISREEALREAYSRDLLPPDMKAAYEQAMDRGLVKTKSTPITLPKHTRMVGGKDPMEYTFDAPGSEAAAKGIDVTTGAPVGRLSSGFAQNEAVEADNYTKQLTEYFEQPVNVTKGEYGLEFMHPKTGLRTLIDEETLSFRDFEDAVAGSLPVAGAVGGGIAGSFFGIPNIGAGLGAGIMDVVRRGIGHKLDVRDAPIEEELLGAAGYGVAEAAFGKGFEYVARGAQGVRNFFKPKVLSAEGAERLSVAAQQDQAIAEEIARRTGEDFQPFTGQLTNDPALLGHQSAAKTDPETAIRFRRQEVQNETALERFYEDLNPASDAPNTAVGRSIQMEARDQTRPRIDAARDVTDQAIDDLRTITRELPAGENSAIVNEATAAAAAARKVVKDEEDLLWNAYKKDIGLNEDTALSNITVPVEGELKVILRRFAAEAKEAIDPEDASGLFRLMPDALKKDGVDLWQLQRYLGSLKRRSRLARHGEVATDPHGRDISRLVKSVQAQRDEFLQKNHPDIYKRVIDAEARTTERAALFDEGVVSQLLRREGGEWTLTDSQLIGGAIGSGDKQVIEHLVSAFSRHPAGVPTLQRSFLKFYRNQVVEDGLPNGTLHRRFMRRHGEAIDVLFPGNRGLKRLGEFEKAVTQRIKRFDNFEKAMQRTFRGKIQDISPENVVTKVFTDKFSVKDVSRLMNLAESAGVGDLYANAIKSQIRTRFYSRTTGIQFNSLDKFMRTNEEKLIAGLGGRYVRDMHLLLQGLKTIRTTETGIATTRRPGLLATIAEGLARVTVARPLSPHGVGLTKAIGFRERAKARAWAEIIEDPNVLRAIIANKNTDVHTQTGMRILGQIAGGYFLDELPDVDVDELIEATNK